jgi:hypothetical protein
MKQRAIFKIEKVLNSNKLQYNYSIQFWFYFQPILIWIELTVKRASVRYNLVLFSKTKDAQI